MLDVEHREVNAFDERDVAVLQLLANRVAVAIENGRLYQQAQSLAALQERQRLARELHDSVSQASVSARGQLFPCLKATVCQRPS